MVELNGYLVSASQDNTIRVFDLDQGKIKFTFDNGFAFNSVEHLVALKSGFLASSSSNVIQIWDITQGKLMVTLDEDSNGHTNLVTDLIELENGDLVSSSFDNSIKVWNLDF